MHKRLGVLLSLLLSSCATRALNEQHSEEPPLASSPTASETATRGGDANRGSLDADARPETPADTAAKKNGVLPAGLCGFAPYLDSVCSSYAPPRFAVVVAEHDAKVKDGLARAEEALANARSRGLEPGYPIAVTYDDLRRADKKAHRVAVVAALFAGEAEAEAYVRDKGLRAEIVELAPEATDPCRSGDGDKCVSAVEMVTNSPAWSESQMGATGARSRHFR